MTDDAQHSPAPSPALVALAREFGVATQYWNWQGEHVLVPASTIVAVLAALGVDASSDEAVQVALEEAEQRPWRRTLPPVVVTRSGHDAVGAGAPAARRARCRCGPSSRAAGAAS